MANPSPFYGWYGDDFTGATDTLSALAEQGRRALLFLRIPTPGQLAAAGPLDALGIAGATRSMAPDAMAQELDEAGRFFAGQGVSILHYKCCSTFDSAPHVGSIGAAVRALRLHFHNPFLPIVGGQPNLGRYCLFGNLFAAAGSGGPVHRIDRHPTMSVHPVTPMAEADLRRHLAQQGLERIALLDYRSHDDTAEAALAVVLASEPDAVLLDVSRVADLAVIGRLISQRIGKLPMLAVGPSSVAQALAGFWGEEVDRTGLAGSDRQPMRDGPVLALVGSLSPVTRSQVEAASGFARLPIDPQRLLGDADYVETLRQDTVRLLADGNVMLITERPPAAPENAGGVAAATGLLLRAIIAGTQLSRLIVAGGDTSSLAIKSLDIWGLSYRAPLVPGAPLCRAHSDDERLDGLDIVLKGGQMGPPDFFAKALEGQGVLRTRS
jgi:uncharacterized protein YgbK (DUF1537 family)